MIALALFLMFTCLATAARSPVPRRSLSNSETTDSFGLPPLTVTAATDRTSTFGEAAGLVFDRQPLTDGAVPISTTYKQIEAFKKKKIGFTIDNNFIHKVAELFAMEEVTHAEYLRWKSLEENSSFPDVPMRLADSIEALFSDPEGNQLRITAQSVQTAPHGWILKLTFEPLGNPADSSSPTVSFNIDPDQLRNSIDHIRNHIIVSTIEFPQWRAEQIALHLKAVPRLASRFTVEVPRAYFEDEIGNQRFFEYKDALGLTVSEIFDEELKLTLRFSNSLDGKIATAAVQNEAGQFLHFRFDKEAPVLVEVKPSPKNPDMDLKTSTYAFQITKSTRDSFAISDETVGQILSQTARKYILKDGVGKIGKFLRAKIEKGKDLSQKALVKVEQEVPRQSVGLVRI